MMRSSTGFALASCLIVFGCEGSPSGTAPTASPTSLAKSAAPAASAKPTASSADVKPTAQPTSAAASFPATPLPSKAFADFTIGLPTGGKLEKSGDNSSLDTPD